MFSCQTASKSSVMTLWIFMRKTVQVPGDTQFGILTERRQCHMQAIMYNVYFCIPCLWFAKFVKINLQSAAQEALVSCVTQAAGKGRSDTWALCETWCSCFTHGLCWEVAGAPRKGSGCPAMDRGWWEVGWGIQLEELLRFEHSAAAQKVFFSPWSDSCR